MPNHHHATPRDWALVIDRSQRAFSEDSCIVELRGRIEALEAAQHAHVTGPAPDAQQLTLVDTVAKAIDEAPTEPEGWSGEARAAIRVVAEWLRSELISRNVADLLDNEAKR